MVTISTIMSTTSSCHRNSEACELNIHPSWAKWVPPSPKGQLGTPWSTLCMRSARSAAKRTTWHSLPHAPACNFARKDEQLVRPGHEELRIPRFRAVPGGGEGDPMCEFTGVNTLGRETLSFFGNVSPVVAEVQSPFPRVRGSLCKSCPQKVHRTVARAQFALQNVKNLHVRSTVGRWGRQNKMCTRLQARPHIRINKNFGVTQNHVHFQPCANFGRFGAALLLQCGFATVGDKLHRHGCAQTRSEKHQWCCGCAKSSS
jgi:hypothetical protein